MDTPWLAEAWKSITEFAASPAITNVLRAALILITGLIAARLLRALAERIARRFTDDPQRHMIIGRAVGYSAIILTGVSIMRQLGFDLSVLLGTAGILTVAIGFASQTSASNLISGLFLVAERPFGVGDIITIGTTSGVVLSIDLLSVKLRTFDNLFVRVPNEAVLKGQVTNLSRFPIRRADIMLHVDYTADLKKITDVLIKLAEDNPKCLIEPKPDVIVNNALESSIELRFSAWTTRENYLAVRSGLLRGLIERFREERISIAFPQRVVTVRSPEALYGSAPPAAAQPDGQTEPTVHAPDLPIAPSS